MIEWIALGLSIVGILLNAKKIIWCWPIWMVSNVLWLSIEMSRNALSGMILWSVFMITNTYGWRQWYKIGKTNGKN